MDMRIALRHSSGTAVWPGRLLQRLRRPGIVLLVVLSAILLWSWLPASDETTELPAANQLVHWQGAGHDWLLVVDPQTRELVVYDASDGRPLQRLDKNFLILKLRAAFLFIAVKEADEIQLRIR